MKAGWPYFSLTQILIHPISSFDSQKWYISDDFRTFILIEKQKAHTFVKIPQIFFWKHVQLDFLQV